MKPGIRIRVVGMLLAFACGVISADAQGQILTFEFSGLAGDEVSADSNANNANLNTSTISRGAGLTASGNSDRFNATSWAVNSIADAVSGNDYMEFTITPKAGYQFSVSSIFAQWQRSATGNTAISLRSSVDSYATDLDTVKAVTDSTSTQTFTWTFTQANSSSPVTYRFYSYAEGTAGSGGPGDGVGNDIVVNGIVDPAIDPPIAAPAANTNVTSFTAAWSSVADADGYEVDVSANAAFTAAGGIVLEANFDADYPPADWMQNSTEQTNTYKRSGAYSVRLNAESDYLATPLIGAAATVGFWSYTTSADPGIVVEYAADAAGPWAAFQESPFNGNTEQWNARSIDMNGLADVYVRFKKIGSGSLYIDDVVVNGPDVPSFVCGYQSRAVSGGATTSLAVTGLVSSTEYFYRVRATNDTSTSGNSGTQGVTTLVMPVPVSQVASAIGANSFVAEWLPVAEAAGYRLDVSTAADFSSYQDAYADRDLGDVTTHTVTGLLGQVTYHYRVRAYDAGSISANSATQTVATVLKSEPSHHASGFASSLATHRTIVLNWIDAAGVVPPDGYIVRGSLSGFDTIPVPSDGAAVNNSLTWSSGFYANRIEQGAQADELRGLSAGTTYYFKLFPVSNSGVLSNYKTNGVVPQVAVTTGVAPFEDFEDKSKPGYPVETVALKSGSWSLDEAVLGGLNSDRISDQLGIRIRNLGSATMLFNTTDVETMTLEYANYTGDTGGKFVVERSIDNGSTWQPVGNEVTCGDTLQTAAFTIHRLAPFRLRIRKTATASDTNRINIDNIRFTPFEHEPSVFRFR